MSRGFVLWFTGLSGSGKSTLTSMVAGELRRRGVHVETLDGDEIRKHLSRGLGFSREDRDENIRRIGFVAKLVARSGACTIAAAISPYREVRNEVRRSIDRFVEVYTECPVGVLAERDPKGLYKKAIAGELKNFTGVDDPYEAPEAPEVHLHTDRETPEQSLAKILSKLEELDLIPAWGRLLRAGNGAGRTALPLPHGGELVCGMVRAAACGSARERASLLPAIDCDALALSHLRSLGDGTFSPLKGFMNSKDYRRVVREMRLESGLPWALPVTLALPSDHSADLGVGREAALRAPDGTLVGTIAIDDIFAADEREAEYVGGAAAGRGSPSTRYVGGTVACFEDSTFLRDSPHASPEGTRARLRDWSCRRTVALQATSTALGASERVARAALEFFDAVLFQPVALPNEELSILTNTKSHERSVADLAPAKWLVAPLEIGAHATAQRLAIHSAVVAKNLGATHLVVLDQGDDANGWLDCYGPGELSIELLPARTSGVATRPG